MHQGYSQSRTFIVPNILIKWKGPLNNTYSRCTVQQGYLMINFNTSSVTKYNTFSMPCAKPKKNVLYFNTEVVCITKMWLKIFQFTFWMYMVLLSVFVVQLKYYSKKISTNWQQSVKIKHHATVEGRHTLTLVEQIHGKKRIQKEKKRCIWKGYTTLQKMQKLRRQYTCVCVPLFQCSFLRTRIDARRP